jgi:hypothetical protein
MRYKYILIADYPAPWREKVYEIVHKALGDAFHVVYCTTKETRRQWTFPLGNHPKTFLKKVTIRAMGGERYFSLGIATFIAKNRPQVLIGFSLYPTTLLGMMIGRLLGSKTIVFADTWLGRDQSINHIQKFVRRVLYRLCGDAFLGASRQTLQMFKHYRPELKDNQLFLSHLCSDNDHFIESLKGKAIERKFDILFSGRISAEKNPLFFADVAVEQANRGSQSSDPGGRGSQVAGRDVPSASCGKRLVRMAGIHTESRTAAILRTGESVFDALIGRLLGGRSE